MNQQIIVSGYTHNLYYWSYTFLEKYPAYGQTLVFSSEQVAEGDREVFSFLPITMAFLDHELPDAL